ncbi:MAG: response regulator transcription factor [Cephaloticoccus sp.]|nr:response regulator transcription factor [Cephaloticoccus sp.]
MDVQSDTPSTKIVIVEDHPAIAVLLGNYIESLGGFNVAGIFGRGDDVIDFLQSGSVDLAILDLGLPDRAGLDVITELRTTWPELKIMVYSALLNPFVVSESLRLGVNGFVEKSAPFEQLGDALRNIVRGQVVLGPGAGLNLREIARMGAQNIQLQSRELVMLRMLSEGAHVKEIAEAVGISVPGAYKVISRLREAFGAKSNIDLALMVGSTITSFAHPNDSRRAL